ncbi:DUF6262 family protein [Streptomyces sp. NPDC002574]|uniref:DUF6262 family protein n=1 Tax=Streptomyces sp. NPDC002574 TaxID=3364652 RepID=UPI00369BC658
MRTTEASRDARVARLRKARQADSTSKTARAQATVSALLSTGQRVSFARVAREAEVSTWFVYNSPAVKTMIREAINDQAHHGMKTAALPPPQRVTAASLQTDLALAREEIHGLKHERDTLMRRVQLALGAEIDNVAQADLKGRIRDLELQNQALTRDLTEVRTRAEGLARERQEADETIASLRLALRKAMRVVP